MIFRTLLFISIILSFSTQAFAGDRTAESLAAKYIEVSGLKSIARLSAEFAHEEIIEQYLNDYKNPDDRARKLIVGAAGNDLEVLLLEIVDIQQESYAKFFTPDELQSMIDFFETDLGRKFLRVQPELTKYWSTQTNRKFFEWGERLAEKIFATLDAAGYERK